MVTIEKMGIPTVGINGEGFDRDYESTAQIMGLAGLPQVMSELSWGSLTAQEVRGDIDKHIDEIVAGLTIPVTVDTGPKAVPIPTQAGYVAPWGNVEQGPVGQSVIKFTGDDHYEALENFQESLLDWGWGDGFPLVPPTEERVREMLAGTSHDAREVVVKCFEPAKGEATVEKIAINAVMAGAKPQHIPVILAATEAMSLDETILICLQSTGPHAPLFWLNGPVIKELGINCCNGALGPGTQSRVNIALGRAMRLIAMNIGGAYVGVKDMDVIGSANKFSMFLGENEEANPWQPFHVENGFDPKTSVVTEFGVESQFELMDIGNVTPEALLNTYVHTIPSLGSADWQFGKHSAHHLEPGGLVMLCPDHATVFAKAGWTKDDIRKYLASNSTMPKAVFDVLAQGYSLAELESPWKDLPPDAPVAKFQPKGFTILVVGGPGPKSAYFSGVVFSSPVTVPIDKWR